MAYIAHMCTTCHHPDVRRTSENSGTCPACSCHTCSPGRSELKPTFDLAGRPVERIIQPGEQLGIPSIKTCRCKDCTALYKELTAA